MPLYPVTTPGSPGDPVFLTAAGKLPAVDGSLLTGVSTTTKTGNVLWVDAVNGNNTTALPGRLDLPYLTITAALAAATAGATILVLPGTYTDATLTMVAGVSVIGLDPINCILTPTITATVVFVTMAASMAFENFIINLNPSAGTTTGISFPAGTSNATAFLNNITVVANPTGTGVVNHVTDAGTGTADPQKAAVATNCFFFTANTATAFGTAYTKTGSGTTVFRDCTFGNGTSGTAGTVSAGTLYLFGCRLTGASPTLSITSTAVVNVDNETSIATYTVASSATLQLDQNTLITPSYYQTPSYPITIPLNTNMIGYRTVTLGSTLTMFGRLVFIA
jgi:Protein of unknown function (DUF1565)